MILRHDLSLLHPAGCESIKLQLFKLHVEVEYKEQALLTLLSKHENSEQKPAEHKNHMLGSVCTQEWNLLPMVLKTKINRTH